MREGFNTVLPDSRALLIPKTGIKMYISHIKFLGEGQNLDRVQMKLFEDSPVPEGEDLGKIGGRPRERLLWGRIRKWEVPCINFPAK